MCSSSIHTPLIATAHRLPSPPSALQWIFPPWIFASHHVDGPLALPDGSLVPPPPPAVLLFHSKMAAAPEPLVCSCIFRLVVVYVPHGLGFFSAAPRHGIPVSSSASRNGGRRFFLILSLHGLLNPSSRKPESDQLGLSGEPREVEGERGTEERDGGWGVHGVGGGQQRPSCSAPAALSTPHLRQ